MRAKGINVALVGVGGYGQRHLRIIGELASCGLLKLVAAADPFFQGREAATQQRLAAEGTRCYDNLRALLEREDAIDLLVLATPIALHPEMVEECLKFGVKLYLEKPPVATIQQLERLIELDKKEQVTVGFQMSALESVAQLKRWIDEGQFGEVQQIAIGGNWPRSDAYYKRTDWAGRLVLGGKPVFDGPATNALAHLLHSITLLSHQGVDQFWEPSFVQAGYYRARPIESYDLASFQGGFANGVEFSSVLSHCSADPVPWEIKVKGTKGTAWLMHDGTRLRTDLGLSFDMVPEHRADPLWQAALAFYKATLEWVSGQQRQLVSLRDCRGYLKIACGGLMSSRGVHSIPRDAFELRGTERVYHVKGLSEAIQTSLTKSAPLEDLDLFSWATPGQRIDLTDFGHISLEDFVCREDALAADQTATDKLSYVAS